MERWQSLYEHRTAFNLSDSGVHPYRFDELIELLGEDVGDTQLGYIQTDGTDELRSAVSDMYPGADASNVLVTTGSAEANFVAVWKLVTTGDRVVVVTPAYAQTDGLARGLGAEVARLPMQASLGWQPEPGAAARTITPGTRLVVITNPGNPTGSLLEEPAIDEFLDAASVAGAWTLVDEVYRGAELDGPMTPTLWGRGDRVVVTSSLSKAYGLAGLRTGWLVAPPEFKASVWERKDYTTIASTALSDRLATLALAPEARGRILQRTREILTTNLAVVERWLAGHADTLHARSPSAGAICFVRYSGAVGSSDLAERLRVEHQVLVVPGDHFGADGYFRIGFGIPTGELEEALNRFSEAIGTGLLEG
jgi:hypothetical protein